MEKPDDMMTPTFDVLFVDQEGGINTYCENRCYNNASVCFQLVLGDVVKGKYRSVRMLNKLTGAIQGEFFSPYMSPCRRDDPEKVVYGY